MIEHSPLGRRERPFAPAPDRGDAASSTMGDIVWFKDLGVTDVASAGGKGANLGELTRAGFPVPPGFVVTAPAYLEAMDRAGVRGSSATGRRGRSRRRRGAGRDQRPLAGAGAQGRHPGGAARAILGAYEQLGSGRVAVRSSATSEDTAGASFAGMNQTFTNVTGAEQLLTAVVDCWASLSVQRVVCLSALTRDHRRAGDRGRRADAWLRRSARRHVHRRSDDRRREPHRDRGGVRARRGRRRRSGRARHLRRAKQGPRVVDVRVGTQTHTISAIRGGDRRVDAHGRRAGRRVLTDEKSSPWRARPASKQHYGDRRTSSGPSPTGQTYLVQSRPITTLHVPAEHAAAPKGRCSYAGSARLRAGERPRTSAAVADGRGALVTGEVLVASMTNPDWVPVLRGRRTRHRRRRDDVPRRDREPRTRRSLRRRHAQGDDGAARRRAGDGRRDEGPRARGRSPHRRSRPQSAPAAGARDHRSTEALATLVYVNLAIADHAEQVAAQPVDGVGLLRAEFMVTDALNGVHPARCSPAEVARSSWIGWPLRSCASRPRSRRDRWCIARSTSAATSSATSKAVPTSNRSRTIR